MEGAYDTVYNYYSVQSCRVFVISKPRHSIGKILKKTTQITIVANVSLGARRRFMKSGKVLRVKKKCVGTRLYSQKYQQNSKALISTLVSFQTPIIRIRL